MTDREKLIELLITADDYEERVCLGNSCKTCPYKGTDCTYKAKADHLIANGVKVLPCKIGDEFWTDWVGITKVKCSMLTQKADGSWKGRFSIDNGWGSSVNVSLEEIGKTLFLTKEEAEAHFNKPPKGE
jgi:hypothetical protein